MDKERILKDKRITTNQWAVVYYLEHYGEAYGATIAKALEMESSSCSRALKALTGYGYVTPTKQEGRNCFYKLNKRAFEKPVTLKDFLRR